MLNTKETFYRKEYCLFILQFIDIAFAELNGRYYGGGVLELTPSEFKSLPIPYTEIGMSDFKKFEVKFKTKKCIDEILTINDLEILNSINLNKDEIQKVQRIKKKLVNKRLRI